jgi:hypothetical protein
MDPTRISLIRLVSGLHDLHKEIRGFCAHCKRVVGGDNDEYNNVKNIIPMIYPCPTIVIVRKFSEGLDGA